VPDAAEPARAKGGGEAAAWDRAVDHECGDETPWSRLSVRQLDMPATSDRVWKGVRSRREENEN